ncbi:hypothetical protein BGX24_012551 [Mortierella sp. AD032]|nr:hypothetical protein BGX24_012551 [Mortierella sp. AD032]
MEGTILPDLGTPNASHSVSTFINCPYYFPSLPQLQRRKHCLSVLALIDNKPNSVPTIALPLHIPNKPTLDELIDAVINDQTLLASEGEVDTMFFNNRDVINYEGNEFYRFRYTDTNVHCSHQHPQLRNLVYATSKNDVYYLYDNSIQHWSPQRRSSTTILGRPLRNLHSRIPNRITTMAAMDEFLIVGGEDGSFTFMNLQTCENPVYDSFTTEHYLEVNGIEITRSRTGAYMSSNDHVDKQLRCLDLTTLQVSATFPALKFANFASQSPDGHMLALATDELEGHVMSVNSREKIATLKGHQRFSFSVAWSPDSRMLATGNDDHSTCVFDTRMLTTPVHILSREVQESVRSLRYSNCGRYLAMAEDRHYVHIVDTTTNYSQAQKIDFVGDISGISFTPDGEGLYIGVSSIDFSSLLEFEKFRPSSGGTKYDQFDPLCF